MSWSRGHGQLCDIKDKEPVFPKCKNSAFLDSSFRNILFWRWFCFLKFVIYPSKWEFVKVNEGSTTLKPILLTRRCWFGRFFKATIEDPFLIQPMHVDFWVWTFKNAKKRILLNLNRFKVRLGFFWNIGKFLVPRINVALGRTKWTFCLKVKSRVKAC